MYALSIRVKHHFFLPSSRQHTNALPTREERRFLFAQQWATRAHLNIWRGTLSAHTVRVFRDISSLPNTGQHFNAWHP